MCVPVELYANRYCKRSSLLFERPMQSRAQLKTKLGPHQLSHIPTQRAARDKQVTPGIVRKVENPLGLIHQNAGRGDLLERPTMRGSLVQSCGRTDGLRER